MKLQFLIASVTPGSGKTLFTASLIRFLKRKGVNIQSYKCGPDFIDPQYLSIASEKSCINLDNWMSSNSHVQFVYNKYGERGDVCVVEGSGGLYDGYDKSSGSSADIAKLLNLNVVLLVNARVVGYSIAAIIEGMMRFDPSVKTIGVVFTQVSTADHFSYLKEACHDVGVECLGFIPYNENYRLLSKHLSFTQKVRKEYNDLFDEMSEMIEKYVDVDKILKLSDQTFPCKFSLPYSSDIDFIPSINRKKLQVTVVRDLVFNFIYKTTIDRLSEIGNITYFSPLYSEQFPQTDLLYIPGGYPELFARQIARSKENLKKIRDYVEGGGKTLAEGAGLSLLGDTLQVREGGTPYKMCNALSIDSETVGLNLRQGYRTYRYNNKILKGFEYNYCNYLSKGNKQISEVKVFNYKGKEMKMPLYRYKNLIANSTSTYWGEFDILRLWE